MKFKHLCGAAGLVVATFTSLLSVSCSKDDKDYLVFKAIEDSAIKYRISGNDPTTFINTFSLRYSKDRTNWTDNWKDENVVDLKKGEQLYLCNLTDTLNTIDNHINFAIDGKVEVSGNIKALINNAELTPYCFAYLFKDASSLVKAPKILAPTLPIHSCEQMFSNCRNLVEMDEISATILEESACDSMFSGCVSLKKTPTFDFKEVANNCCRNMFYGCYYLEETRGKLSAMTLAENCYIQMFFDCHFLKEAPKLPATTLAIACYQGMFSSCFSLKKAPELPATSLEGADKCYRSMFQYCYSLKEAPKLPATTLAYECYFQMFRYCYGLIEAPELPATSLEGANTCYKNMFLDCYSLIHTPSLPATTLSSDCYYSMFSGCTALTDAEIMATELNSNSLKQMFNGCNSLNRLKVHFAPSYLGSSYTSGWLSNAGNLAAHPVFYSNEISGEISRSTDTVPSYWDIQKY